MSITQIINNQVPASEATRTSAKADQDFTLDRQSKTSVMKAGSVTLPSSSAVGDTHTIVAGENPVIVKGNGKLIGGETQVQISPYTTAFFCLSESQGNVPVWAYSSGTGNGVSKQAQNQPNWFINPVSGNDAHKGDTPAKALKTYAAWQDRVGRGTVLNPTGGFLKITILNDLPPSDPITFDNTMAPGTTALRCGTKKVLGSGIIDNVLSFEREINQPNVITVTDGTITGPDYWAPHIAKFVESGDSRAPIVNGFAQILSNAGTYNTGFTGGETLTLGVGADPDFVVTFANADETRAQVIAAINAEWQSLGQVGHGVAIAKPDPASATRIILRADFQLRVVGGSAGVLATLGLSVTTANPIHAQVGTWVSKFFVPDGFVFPSFVPPVDGDPYEIVSFTEVTQGYDAVGYDQSGLVFGAFAGGLCTAEMSIRNDYGFLGNGGYGPSFPLVKGGATDTISSFVFCLFLAAPFANGSGTFYVLGSCITRTPPLHFGGRVVVLAGLFRPLPGVDYPGGLSVQSGGMRADGDTVFFGILGGDATVPDPNAFTPADLQSGGLSKIGPMNFWRTVHALNALFGGSIVSEPVSPFYGDQYYTPLWGDDNTSFMDSGANASIFISQYVATVDAPLSPRPPTIVMGKGPAGANVGAPNARLDSDKANGFNATTALYTPLADTTWANLDVPVGAGGFRQNSSSEVKPEGTVYSRSSVMLWPDNQSQFRFDFNNFDAFPPPP